MIGFRSFFRTDRAWRFTHTHVTSKPAKYPQGCCCFHVLSYHRKMSGAEDRSNVVKQGKKQKAKNVWRPVSTRSNSHEDCLMDDVKVEAETPNVADSIENFKIGSLVPEVPCGIAESVSDIQHVKDDCNQADLTNSIASSHALKSTNGHKSMESGTIPSADKHCISVLVGSSLIRFIKGKGGLTKRKIEDEIGVNITFPSSRHEEFIRIEGNSIESVDRATEKIQVIIDEAVKSPNLDYSHFISLPLAIHPELVDKLVNFQNSVLGYSNSDEESPDSNSDADCLDDEQNGKQDERPDVAVKLRVADDSSHVKVDLTNVPLISYKPKAVKVHDPSELGIDRSIFIKPKTFHLTVLMLKLWNKERVDAAVSVFQSVSSKIMDALSGRPVLVKLKGLSCMQGSISKARVLYAPVEEADGENRLVQVCQIIIDAYIEAGLVLEKDARQVLKLHATVLNARHRKRKRKTRKLDSFNAKGIFDRFGSEEWGTYLIREAHLSQRFAFDENGYYRCCASIPFPETS